MLCGLGPGNEAAAHFLSYLYCLRLLGSVYHSSSIERPVSVPTPGWTPAPWTFVDVARIERVMGYAWLCFAGHGKLAH